MKAVVLLAVLACALGLPHAPIPGSYPAAPAPAAAGNRARSLNHQGSFGGGAQYRSGGNGQHQRNWGPKAYGPGLNNRWAIPVNPFVMERAIAITNKVPGTLVRVGIDGEVQITDQHGVEAEIVDWFGNDITEGIDEFEHGPFGFGGFGGFGGSGGPGGFGGHGGFGGPASFSNIGGFGGSDSVSGYGNFGGSSGFGGSGEFGGSGF